MVEQYIYVELNIFAGMIAVLLLVLTGSAKKNFPGRGLFLSVVGTVLSILFFDTVYQLVDGAVFAGARVINIITNVLYFIAQGFACCLFGLFCAKLVGLKRKPWALAIYFLPLLFSTVISLVNLGTEMIYTVDARNVYARTGGVWYPVYMASVVVYLLFAVGIFLWELWRHRKIPDFKYRNDDRYMAVVMIIPFLGTAIQIAFFGVTTIWICGIFTLMLIYSRISGQLAARTERELTDSRIATMRSQIQPHFIFNTLATIRTLCGEDGEKAQYAIEKFSQYLRSNLDSLSNPTPIVFEKELEYVETYIDLEKIRFGDRLNFKTEIGTTDFTVPMLSIQPLIENAVHHGISRRKGGGTITLSTEDAGSEIYIGIRDDGVGFDPGETFADGHTHTGIENVRMRVETLCDGNLIVKSVPGDGTEIRVVLPKRKKKGTVKRI